MIVSVGGVLLHLCYEFLHSNDVVFVEMEFLATMKAGDMFAFGKAGGVQAKELEGHSFVVFNRTTDAAIRHFQRYNVDRKMGLT